MSGGGRDAGFLQRLLGRKALARSAQRRTCSPLAATGARHFTVLGSGSADEAVQTGSDVWRQASLEGMGPKIGAPINTYTILVISCYSYSIMGPKTLF